MRAYHHGDRKNPQGDLLGFDHEGRGHTTMADWRAPRPGRPGRVAEEASGDVVKDTGERAPLPPFTDEHEELRESIAPLRRAPRSLPTSTSGRRRASSRASSTTRRGELGFLGLKYPEELGGQGGDDVHDAVWAEELPRSGGSGGVGAGLGAHTAIATPPIFNFGTDEQHERFLRPGDRGREDLRARDHRARRRLRRRLDPDHRAQGRRRLRRQRLQDLHHQRRPRRLPRLRRQTTEEGGHDGISFLILERDMPGYEVSRKLEKMGWHSSDTGELAFTDVEVPEENLLGEENEGFKLIMANFAVGAAADGARRGRRDGLVPRDDARLRARARGVRPPDRQLPGDPPQVRRDGDEDRGRRAR